MKEKTRFIFLIEYSKGTGGMVKSTLSMIEGFIKMGLIVSVIAPSNRDYQLPRGALIEEVSRSWRLGRQSFLRSFVGGLAVADKVLQHKDFVLIINNEDSLYTVGLIVRGFLGRNKVLYVNRGTRFSGIRLLLLRVILPLDTKIIATSSSISRHMNTLGYKNVDVVGNYCSDHGFVRRDYNGKLRAVCLGYYNSNKNQKLIIELLSAFPEIADICEFHMYGKIEEDRGYYNVLMEMIKIKGITSVFCHDYVSDTSAVYKSADIVLSVSKSEGFGRTLIEGMSSGCVPVAYSLSGGPSDIIDHGDNGYLFETINDLKKVLISLKNPVLLAELSIKARFDYERKWNGKSVHNKWRDIIRSL